MNAVHLLLLAAVASPLLALLSTGQDPATQDWGPDVEKACSSPRLGLRIAASRKVAKAGAAAVPAVRAFAAKQGLLKVPQTLVDAFADDAPADAATLQLLVDWSTDRDFFWRASALRGIALRLDGAGARRDEMVALLRTHQDDPAWLMRTHARLGLALTGDDSVLTRAEEDPRGRARLAVLLLQQGKVPPLQPLLDALADERSFLDVPWGKKLGDDAHRALKAWLGEAHPLAAGGSFTDTAAALQAMRDACAKKSGQALVLPTVRTDAGFTATGWIELLSCKHGDHFVQWNATGEVRLGIDGAVTIALPAPAWDALSRERTALAPPERMGEVICDSIRLRWLEPQVHAKAAPASLPAPIVDWLKHLARALEEAGEPRRATELRAAIDQFATR